MEFSHNHFSKGGQSLWTAKIIPQFRQNARKGSIWEQKSVAPLRFFVSKDLA
jgi:hypothetical protein